MYRFRNMYRYFFLLFPSVVAAQSGFIPVNNKVIVNFPDHTVYTEIIENGRRIHPSEDKYYYWFNSNDIKRTKGGYDGKLLHGMYRDFYLNKNLKEKGFFKKGLKKGKWIGWYPNGEYKEITTWRNGERNGKTQWFNEQGQLIRKGRYKNDLLTGKVHVFHPGDSVRVIKYKQGEPVEESSKSSKKIAGFFHRSTPKEKKEISPETKDETPSVPNQKKKK